jgi:Zn-dependent protease with chaperone function
MKYKYASIKVFKSMAVNQKIMLFESIFLILCFYIRIMVVTSLSPFMLIAVIWAIVNYILTIKEINSRFTNYLVSKYYMPLPGAIQNKINLIKNENMHVKNVNIKYLVVLTNYGINASVLKNKNTQYLILSLGLIKQLLKDDITAKKIILHEFGHIFFNDLNMFIVVELFLKKCKFLYIYLAILLVLMLFIDYPAGLSLLIGFATLFLIPMWAKLTHKWCEFRADYFAVLSSNYTDYIALLNNLDNGNKYLFSPTNSQRIEFLKKVKEDSNSFA